MVSEDAPKIYNIPDNFIDESRILKGMFKTRNFIEGIVLALIGLIPGLLLTANSSSIQTKLMVITLFCGPFFLLGNYGFNGDSIFTTLKYIRKWSQNRRILLYNTNSKALKETPLNHMMSQPVAKDKVLDIVDEFREKRRLKNAEEKYIEGETFEFKSDSELAELFADDENKAVGEMTNEDSFAPMEIVYDDSEIIPEVTAEEVQSIKMSQNNDEVEIEFEDDLLAEISANEAQENNDTEDEEPEIEIEFID